jgi:hypothetical protein
MSFYIYRPVPRQFLADDEKSWTPSMLEAAEFMSRSLAAGIAARELGKVNDAVVLDDGQD